MKYKKAFEIVKERVMPFVLEKASRELAESGVEDGPRQAHAHTWWRFWRGRPEVIARLKDIPRYIACSSVTKRPIFEFISSTIHPNAAVIAFTFSDDYSFGVLQSVLHWNWFTAKCSTLTERFRYTSETVFDTFPWPQSPNLSQVKAVAQQAAALRSLRREIMAAHGWSLRELYRIMETPGSNKLRDAQASLNSAVRSAYGMQESEDTLTFLLGLNLELAKAEAHNTHITPPGLPAVFNKTAALFSTDCIQP